MDIEAPEGTQSVRRAMAIVRFLASLPEVGATISDIATALDLNRSTAHRIVNSLVDERLLEFHTRSGLYSVGSLPAELALNSIEDFHHALEWEVSLQAVAAATNQTTYLMAKSGDEVVCIKQAFGESVFRIAPFKLGHRSPLGIGPSGCALLALRSEGEIRAYVDAFYEDVELARHYGFVPRETMLSDALACKREGFALTISRITSNLFGLGVALPTECGRELSICITAHLDLLDQHDPGLLFGMLRDAVAAYC